MIWKVLGIIALAALIGGVYGYFVAGKDEKKEGALAGAWYMGGGCLMFFLRIVLPLVLLIMFIAWLFS